MWRSRPRLFRHRRGRRRSIFLSVCMTCGAKITGSGTFVKVWAKSVLVLLGILGLTGCSLGPPAPIVVFCSPEGSRVQQAVEGLKAGLEGAGPLEVVWARGAGEEAREQLRQIRRRHPRLLVVFGTPALMLVAPEEKRLPLVFALVGDPYFTGGAYDAAHPELHQENLTGIASPAPVAAALEQGAGLLGPRTWGLIFDPNDGVAAELKDAFLQEASKFGVKPLAASSTDASGDRRGLEELRSQGARVFYLPPAPSAARYAPRLLAWGRQGQVAVVSSLPEGEQQGALLWIALDYRALGREAAALARRLLAGEKPPAIPIITRTPLRIEVDEALLRRWSDYPAPH